jgi:3-oxoacyl-[acyl-carrier-protein] synthase-3
MNSFTLQIIGTGSSIPALIKTNKDFGVHRFYDHQQQPITTDPELVAMKFQEITGIEERRYALAHQNASDLGFEAAQRAIEAAGINPESLDFIVVAHNFGDVPKHHIQTDILPSLAARIKKMLAIKNPQCNAYDLLFGCPGWIEGLIQVNAFFQAGMGTRALVIGTETLSRVLDPYDRDSMIFSDGAGACVVEYKSSDRGAGLQSFAHLSFCDEEVDYLNLGKSNFPDSDPRVRYIKMQGRKVYEFAMKHVPLAMKDCLDKSGADVSELKKVFIHQANEKMDFGIINRFYRLYGQRAVPEEEIMPMSIHKLGNSSVATVPTLLDMVLKRQLEGHEIHKGDLVLMASVGAGMHINALVYRF